MRLEQRSGAAYVGLGSNLGDRLGYLRAAVERLRDYGAVEVVSDVYETDPVGYADQPAFLNAVLRLRTGITPADLLAGLLAIEAALGRTRSFPNAPRTLDLDLLLYDQRVLDTADLVLPHPRLLERAFVLVPLAAIAPALCHPLNSVRVDKLLAQIGGARGVSVFAGGSLAKSPGTATSEPAEVMIG